MARDGSTLPGWIPDWRDSAAYSEFTTRGDLAWQFLRRNPEYQEDWARYESVPTFWPDVGGKTPKLSGRGFAPWASMIYYYADPPGRPDETLQEYESRMDGANYSVTNLEDGLCRKWGVMSLIDPAKSLAYLSPYGDTFPIVGGDEDVFVVRHHHLPEPFKVVSGGYLFGKYSPPYRAIASVYSADPETIENPPNVVPVWFSLDHNLKAQLDDALVQLKALRDEMERKSKYRSAPSVATLVTALRVYDARLSNVPHDDIRRVLDRFGGFNTAGTARDTDRDLKLAKKMIETGYRVLIGSE